MDMNHGICTPNIIVNCKPPEMRHLGKIEGKTKRQNQDLNNKDRITNNALQIKERISTMQMIWAHLKNENEEISQNGLES
jgi:hypothetical protein